MSKSYILAISEGEKAEKHLLESIEKLFFCNEKNKHELKIISFKTNIYALWKALKNDDFETDIVDVLIEKERKYKDDLEKIKKCISEIYLFFDYDGHAYNPTKGDDIILEMIKYFNNETENGKIYISYPMVEAIKDLKTSDNCSRRCLVEAKRNINYKKLVQEETNFEDLRKFDKNTWYYLSSYAVKKANCIINSKFENISYEEYICNINQLNLFEKQFQKFISRDNKIAVISSFPFFLIDYFGEDLFNQINSQEYNNFDKENHICVNFI